MRSLAQTSALLACLFGTTTAFSPSTAAFSRSYIASQPARSSTQQYMFGGAGSPLEEDDEYTEEEQANIAAAATQLGFSVDEYKLVLRMQKNLANSVDSLRVTGGDASKGVTITMDGNSPPKFLEVDINDEGKALGKAGLESSIIAALKEANAQAKKGQEEAVKKMNGDIAEEMKKMGA